MHERGVCHRDIKRDNIIIKDGKHLILMDFGVSKYFRKVSSIRKGLTLDIIEPD